MAYFNHAFHKAFLATAVVEDPTLQTQDLTSAQFAIVDDTYSCLNAAGIAASTGLLMLAQGSLHGSDTIGSNPGHGGYLETTKSKGINSNYITKIWHSCCAEATCAQLEVIAIGECFECGTNPYFRLDIKGSPALRFLNHNAYAVVDTGNICCDDITNPNGYIDPTYILAQIALNLLENPIVSPFIQISLETWDVLSGGYVVVPDIAAYVQDPGPYTDTDNKGKLIIDGCYVDTKFGNCSFRTTDFYEKEPVTLIGTFVDDSGDPCKLDCVTYNGETFGVAANGTMEQTQGETVIRDVLLTEQYMQSPYNQGNADSSRIREIEGSDDIKNAIDRTARYDRWYILHNVPRFNNPTGVFDNDQYLYTISSLCDSETAGQVKVLLDALAALADVVVEEDCDL